MSACPECKKNKVLYNLHSVISKEDCPFIISQYCLYCCEKGHTINICKKKQYFPPVAPDIYRCQTNPYILSIDIRSDDRVIGAFLTAHGIQRSQKDSKNLKNLKTYVAELPTETQLTLIKFNKDS